MRNAKTTSVPPPLDLDMFLSVLRQSPDNAVSCLKYLGKLKDAGLDTPEIRRSIARFVFVDVACAEGAYNQDGIVADFFDFASGIDDDTLREVLSEAKQNKNGKVVAFLLREPRLTASQGDMALETLLGLDPGSFFDGAKYATSSAGCQVEDATTPEQRMRVWERLFRFLRDEGAKERTTRDPEKKGRTSEFMAALSVVQSSLGVYAKEVDRALFEAVKANLKQELWHETLQINRCIRWNVLACAPHLLEEKEQEQVLENILRNKLKNEFVSSVVRRVSVSLPFFATCSVLCSGGRSSLTPDEQTAEYVLKDFSRVFEENRENDETLETMVAFYENCVARGADKWPGRIRAEMEDMIAAEGARRGEDVEGGVPAL